MRFWQRWEIVFFSIFAAFAVFAAIGMLANKQDIDLSAMIAVEQQVAELEQLEQSNPEAFAAARERYDRLVARQSANEQFQSQMSTFGLLFKTYPAILTEMGPVAGRVFGVLFFLSLLIAGISSSISIVEAFMAALCDQFGWSRSRTSAVLCSVAFLLGTVFCTQAGLFLLDLVDHFITTYALVLVAICEALIVGWIFPARRLREHLDEYRDFRFGKTFSVIMRVLITAVLILTWVGLGQLESIPLASGIARLALLAATVILWIDQHWLDFDIRVIIPVLLLVLLDQALVREFRSAYGGYSVGSIVSVGLTWLIGTLIIGIVLDKMPTSPETAGTESTESDPPVPDGEQWSLKRHAPQIRDYMTHLPIEAERCQTAADAVEIMQQQKVHHVPVMSGSHLRGIVTEHDLLEAPNSTKRRLFGNTAGTDLFIRYTDRRSRRSD